MWPDMEEAVSKAVDVLMLTETETEKDYDLPCQLRPREDIQERQ